eukprot:TRINITY_DN5736_c0_g2_i3.p1 TRINITY_DN5736_c0_g2~~TRINITY_DN5736_c0_g2_i3.p1  ORF type:complete len:174 (+),score=31.05 TRINITY_DN5736_c0_g2_i3:62-583(+)
MCIRDRYQRRVHGGGISNKNLFRAMENKSQSEFQFKWVKADDPDFEHVVQLRTEIFHSEQGIDKSLMVDDDDQDGFHVVMFEKQQSVGSGRLVKIDGDWRIGRVCIVKSLRGKGYGKLLMEECHRFALEQGIKNIKIESQRPQQKFYEKLGYEAYGDVFVKVGIEHIKMEISL